MISVRVRVRVQPYKRMEIERKLVQSPHKDGDAIVSVFG